MNVSDRVISALLYVLITYYFPDDPNISRGTPVGFQVVGRRFQEEKMIAIAELFEKALAAEAA